MSQSDGNNAAPSGATVQAPNEIPEPARNVPELRPRSLDEGFGQLWHKRFWVELQQDIPCERLIEHWKANFDDFWPPGTRFHHPPRGVVRGAVAGVELGPEKGPQLETGVIVVESEPCSFALASPPGHMFAGRNRFIARQVNGKTIAEIEILVRASDPLYELGLMLGGNKTEDAFWRHHLRALARSLGENPEVHQEIKLEDPHRLWRNAGNIRHNAAIRSFFRGIFGRLRDLFRPRPARRAAAR